MRDSDVRKATLKMLTDRHAGDVDTRIVEEMGVWSGSVRIDIAVINGELSGFELKSDRDTLERLPFQADLYSRVFDNLHLIVGSRHASKASALVPEWWGIMVATLEKEKIVLTSDRGARDNPSPDPYLIAQLLWKSEAISALACYGLDKGCRSKPVKLIHRRLATELPLGELKNCVRSILKVRTNWLKADSSALTVCVDSRRSLPT